MANFSEWLINQYQLQADGYRMALHMEIAHCQKIYGNPLPEDVVKNLKSSLHDIKVPEMQRWTGDRTGTMEIFNKTRKPNFSTILQDAIITINL
jgi:hypothetical protein